MRNIPKIVGFLCFVILVGGILPYLRRDVGPDSTNGVQNRPQALATKPATTGRPPEQSRNIRPSLSQAAKPPLISPVPNLLSQKDGHLDEKRKDIEDECRGKTALIIIRDMEKSTLSPLFMPSLKRILLAGATGALLRELPNDPRVRRVLDEAARMAKEDNKGYDELIEALQDGLRRYIHEFPDERTTAGYSFEATVRQPGAAAAWPYLLAKLDDNPSNLALIAEAGQRLQDSLIRQYVRDQEDAKAWAQGSPTVVPALYLENSTGTILAYAARLYLDQLCLNADMQEQLSVQARTALQEYQEYENTFQNALNNAMPQLDRVMPGAAAQLQGSNDEMREGVAAEMGLYGQIVPPSFANRDDAVRMRPDFILEFAREVTDTGGNGSNQQESP